MDNTDHDCRDPVPGFRPQAGAGTRVPATGSAGRSGFAAEPWLAALPGKPVRRDTSALLPDNGDPWRAFAVCGAPG
ncbi:MAG: hypothetical protein IPL03_18620 [Sterolibacteriaceae bacterium]|nr:hypothetical protein [Candidatus Methylophosphatis haderslevensis]